MSSLVPVLPAAAWQRPLLRGMAVLALPLALAACTSLHNPVVRGDLYETQVRGTAALSGSEPAFVRLGQLQKRWDHRGADNLCHRLLPWDRDNRARARIVAGDIRRIAGAHDAVMQQRETVQVIANALRNIEDEYDTIFDTLQQGGGQADADLQDEGTSAEGRAGGSQIPRAIAEQKYLARRMAGSLALLSSPDMSQAIEAADQFGRDANRFRKLLDAAINGDASLGMAPAADSGVQDSLSQIDELFGGYIGDSTADLLDSVVLRYDAWQALAELNTLTPVAAGKRKAEPAAAAPAPAAAPADASAAEAPGAAEDEGAAGPADVPADEGGAPADPDAAPTDDGAAGAEDGGPA